MARAETLSVAVTVEQAAALRDAVESGAYANSGDIIREALDDWAEKQRYLQADAGILRALWAEGKTSGPATPVDFDNVLDEVRRDSASGNHGL